MLHLDLTMAERAVELGAVECAVLVLVAISVQAHLQRAEAVVNSGPPLP